MNLVWAPQTWPPQNAQPTSQQQQQQPATRRRVAGQQPAAAASSSLEERTSRRDVSDIHASHGANVNGTRVLNFSLINQYFCSYRGPWVNWSGYLLPGVSVLKLLLAAAACCCCCLPAAGCCWSRARATALPFASGKAVPKTKNPDQFTHGSLNTNIHL